MISNNNLYRSTAMIELWFELGREGTSGEDKIDTIIRMFVWLKSENTKNTNLPQLFPQLEGNS